MATLVETKVALTYYIYVTYSLRMLKVTFFI